VGLLYNRIAGKNLERLSALSDGVFSVAMTLLVLDLRVPATVAARSEHDVFNVLVALVPRFIPYLMSFLTVGIFWIGQQTQISAFARSDRHLAWIHLCLLFAVTMMPFSTTFLAQFITFRVALLVYWANILVLGLVLFASWQYASRAQLLRDDAPPGIGKAIVRRIAVAQACYAFGALLCAINTYVSMAFIVLVQLYYATGIGYRPAAQSEKGAVIR